MTISAHDTTRHIFAFIQLGYFPSRHQLVLQRFVWRRLYAFIIACYFIILFYLSLLRAAVLFARQSVLAVYALLMS